MEEKKTKEPQYNEPKMMLHLAIYSAVGKYKSIRRAIRKGQAIHLFCRPTQPLATRNEREHKWTDSGIFSQGNGSI